ncbi:hypothetical protein BDQ17DRAFT_1350476 [Cyathus striatus]|nr:hypothetical protein BDQ17DRAFT_1350476 [Cyathus striatus]
MPTVPVSQEAIALSITCILFGLYLSTLLHSLRWLLFIDSGWKLRSWRTTNWIMLLAITALFGFALANLSLALQGLMSALKSFEKDGSAHVAGRGVTGEPTSPSVVAVVTCTTANVSALIADCVLVLSSITSKLRTAIHTGKCRLRRRKPCLQ